MRKSRRTNNFLVKELGHRSEIICYEIAAERWAKRKGSDEIDKKDET